jgi:hypothetical protein
VTDFIGVVPGILSDLVAVVIETKVFTGGIEFRQRGDGDVVTPHERFDN